jgi:hypothetical protein
LHFVAHEIRLGELTTVPWPITTTVRVTAREERSAAALPVTVKTLANMKAASKRGVDALLGLARKP